MQRGRSREAPRRGARIARPQAAAIIAAGGSGSRIGGNPVLPKQFSSLRGKPLIRWSCDVLAAAGCSPIVVVVPEAHLDAARTTVGEACVVVSGGATRTDSVRNGLDHVGDAPVTVVHDAARPFLDVPLVHRCIDLTSDASAAVAAVPVADTVKRVSGGSVVATVDRSDLWTVQTPQAFRTEALREAHARAVAAGENATDDAALVERAGGRVVVVQSSTFNIKITYPDDLILAEAIAADRDAG